MPSKFWSIHSFWGTETNPSANPNTSNNGGGYRQPSGGVLFTNNVDDQTVVIDIDDMSCGDFGSRIFVDINVDDRTYRGAFGSMDDATIDNADYADNVVSAAGYTGISIDAMYNMIDDAIHAVHYAANE